MKKIKMILSLLLSLIIAVPFAGLAVNAESTVLTQNTVIRSGNTYYINNSDDLKTLSILINEKSQDCTGATIELTDNIYLNKGRLSYEDGTPMYGGEAISENNAPSLFRSMAIFKGTFDGKGHTISGLYSKGSGLFEEAENAVIKDVIIKNALIIPNDDDTGAVCGTAINSVISGCSFYGIISVKDNVSHTGGIVGCIIGGTLSRCTNYGDVLGLTKVGGIVGISGCCLMELCKNEGSVYGANYVGGIAGDHGTASIGGIPVNEQFKLYGLCNKGKVKASNSYAGGIAGYLSINESSTMSCSYNTGEINALFYAGGLAGKMHVEGDSHSDEISEMLYMQVIIDRYYSDGIHTMEWPPKALADTIDFERYSELDSIINSNARNIRNCYAGGTAISSGHGKTSIASVCGEFSGCVWNFVNCYVNSFPYDGNSYISYMRNSARSTNVVNYNTFETVESVVIDIGIEELSDSFMQTERFLSRINRGNGKFIFDKLNENNGYPLLEEFHDESIHVHNYVYEITKEATCLENGIKTYTCECGDSYTEEIPAIGSHIVKFIKIIKEPTCTEEGSSRYICENCGKDFILPIQAKGHYYDRKVLKPYDCQTGGSEQYTCERCGDSYVKDYASEGHDYSGGRYKHLPSITTNGIMRKYCRGCDSYIVEETEMLKASSGKIFAECFGDAVRVDDYIYYPVKIYQEFDLKAEAERLLNTYDKKAKLTLKFYFDEDMLSSLSVCPSKKLLEKNIRLETSKGTNCITVKAEFDNIDDFTDDLLLFSFKYYCPDDDALVKCEENNSDLYDRSFKLFKPERVSAECYVFSDEYYKITALVYSAAPSFKTKEGALEYLFSKTNTLEDIKDTIVTSSINSVSYEPSDSALNDYTFKVNGQANKIAFLFRNNSTLTVARSGAKIKSFDKDGNEVPQGSKNIDYELWTVHRSLKVNEEIKVRAKFSTGWEDEFKSFTVYLKYQELPFVESVTYTPSFSAENDYVLKVNCIADKVQFINPNGTTATYTKSSAKSVVSFDKNGNEVPVNSKDTAYEIWTIHRTMKTDCEMFVHVKTGGKWENETKAFIVELKKKDVSSIESVTWKGDAVSRNDYYIKVNGRPDKIAFVNPDGTTATYSRDKAKIKCYDANGNEVPSDSKNISYEIWTINRSMRMNVEMRAVAKFGKTIETEMFTFTVK